MIALTTPVAFGSRGAEPGSAGGVILEPLVDGFERLRHELADSRLDHLLGGLPVRPPSDASVDRVICGDGGHPEIARVLRRSSPRKGHEIPTFP